MSGSAAMRILVISGAFPPMKAGEADHVFQLCHNLAERGADVHVLTTTRNVAPRPVPFKLHSVIHNWAWGDVPRLVGSIKEIAPDAILLIYTDWVYQNHLMITFAPVLAKALYSRVPFVTLLETEEISLKASLWMRVVLKIVRSTAGPQKADQFHMKTLLWGSDRVIFLSERHRDRLVKNFPRVAGKGTVIPPPAIIRMYSEPDRNDRAALRRSLGLDPTEFVIVSFGYIYGAKGVDTLFSAIGLLKDHGRRVKLVIVGGGVDLSNPSADVRLLIEQAERLGITENIVWTGAYRSDSDVPSRYLYSGDACVMPFNSGVTLNRSSFAAAAAHGLPVVTTRGQTLESAFIDGENVYLCPPKDPTAVASAIEALMDDPGLARKLRAGALRLANEYFSPQKAVDRTIEALSGSNGRWNHASTPPSSAARNQ
jgi:polysaccharide biosynthesis protein PslF